MGRAVRGALVGAAGGLAWRAVEPLLQRELGSPYSDPGIVAGIVARGRARTALEYAVQAAGGAAFGAAYGRFGGRGIRSAVGAALVEDVAFWPAVAVLQRFHPDVRAGRWPKPFRDPRSFQVSAAGHVLFGAVLGAVLDPPPLRTGS